MKLAVRALVVTAACLATPDAAGAETVVAGTDGAISYYVAREDAGQRSHKFVRPDGSGGLLPIPSGLGNSFVPGAPFSVEISPDGRLFAYRESAGTRQGRLVIGEVEGGGALTLATAGDAPHEAGRPHLDGTISGLSFAPDGRRLAVSTFDDDLNVKTEVLTLDLLVDNPPKPVPPPRRLSGNVSGMHWDGNRILASQKSGPESFVTVAFDSETYASLGQIASAVCATAGRPVS